MIPKWCLHDWPHPNAGYKIRQVQNRRLGHRAQLLANAPATRVHTKGICFPAERMEVSKPPRLFWTKIITGGNWNRRHWYEFEGSCRKTTCHGEERQGMLLVLSNQTEIDILYFHSCSLIDWVLWAQIVRKVSSQAILCMTNSLMVLERVFC